MPRLGANQQHPEILRKEPLTLSNQEPYPNSRHVEPIQPCLYIISAVPIPKQSKSHTGFDSLCPLPLQDPLGDSGDRWIMSAFDGFQSLGESGIIIVYLRWINMRGGLRVVTAGGRIR